jgi:hypothetical protein
MIKKEVYSYLGGANVDMPPSKRSKNQYFTLRNGRITSGYSNGESLNIPSNGIVRCQNGNTVLFEFTSIDNIYANSGSLQVSYKIDGDTVTPTFDGVVNQEIVDLATYLPVSHIEIIATTNEGPITYFLTTTNSVTYSEHSIDCIWSYAKYDGLKLLYINDLGWNSLVEQNLDIVINVESEKVVKLYVADGEHQVFSINTIGTSDLAKTKKVLYMVPQYIISEPYLKQQIPGGQLTSGAIQYVYNLFNVSGGQTKISPASDLIFIGKTSNGGDVNEIVGKSNVIRIDNIDSNYDYMKVYSIKYNDLNTTPIVSIIGEFATPKGVSPNTGSITVIDDGRAQSMISIEELTFLGGSEIIPRCIVAKKNRLILGNINEQVWDVNLNLLIDDENFFDSRAYSANESGDVIIKDKEGNSYALDTTARAYTISGDNVSIKHDAIQNKNMPVPAGDGIFYYLHPDGSGDPGGEGRFVSYKVRKTFTYGTSDSIESQGFDVDESRYLKSGEVYRWGIEFYDSQSRKSTPQWIADVKVPPDFGYLQPYRTTIEFTISSAGIAILKAQGIIGYKFLRVERLESDKSIVAQGIVTPMIFQETSADAKINANESNGNLYKDRNVKISSPWVRHYQDQVDLLGSTINWQGDAQDIKIFKLDTNSCINVRSTKDTRDRNPLPWTEIYRDTQASNTLAPWAGLQLSFQDNRIMQLFSPETIFGNPAVYGNMRVRNVATLQQVNRASHGRLVNTDLTNLIKERTSDATTNLFLPSLYPAVDVIGEDSNFLHANGYIGPNKPYPSAPGISTEQLIQYNREYKVYTVLAKKSDGTANEINVAGSPLIGKLDSNIYTYNGNDNYRFTNSLQSIIADGRTEFVHDGGNNVAAWNQPIYGVDAIASQNITFMESTQVPYETIFKNAVDAVTSGLPGSYDNVLLAELVVDIENQYGGKYYEDRSINKYIDVGKYQSLVNSDGSYIAGDDVYNIINCGDTFVGDFLFSRITRIDGVSFSGNRIQMNEIVKIPVETSYNITQRSDDSFGGWKAIFLPTNAQFHKYNNVYSQLGNAIISQPDPFLLIKNTHFANRILATKPKVAGEIIDSWTDVLLNEEIYVEGEYGRINRMVKFNDILYVFQRDGVCVVSVLPRVQVSATDAIAIELGTGQVLNTYQYINTNSGCDDFNGIVSTSSATYYGDRIRRTINLIEGATVSGLSDTLGISQYVKGYDTDEQYKPKFVLGFNPITDDVYFTIKRQSTDGLVHEGDTESLVYDEGIKRFTTILDMPAEFVFTIDGKLHSISNTQKNTVWNHFIGNNSCNFYGVQYPLELVLCLNPENAEGDCFFNSLEWTHDIVNTTNPTIHYNDNLSTFDAYNDYLTAVPINSTDMPNAIKRRYRMSRLYIPRSNADNISRIRGHYLFIKLTYTPDNPDKTILLNDVVLYYNDQRTLFSHFDYKTGKNISVFD